MAEAFNDLTLPGDKAARYATVAQEIASVLDDADFKPADGALIGQRIVDGEPGVRIGVVRHIG